METEVLEIKIKEAEVVRTGIEQATFLERAAFAQIQATRNEHSSTSAEVVEVKLERAEDAETAAAERAAVESFREDLDVQRAEMKLLKVSEERSLQNALEADQEKIKQAR